MILYSVPVYFLQGLRIRRWDHETRPREGSGFPCAVLKLPVINIRVGLEV